MPASSAEKRSASSSRWFSALAIALSSMSMCICSTNAAALIDLAGNRLIIRRSTLAVARIFVQEY